MSPLSQTIKCIIATLESDGNYVRKCFENAIRLSPSFTETYTNYATSLRNLRFIKESIDNLKIAYELEAGSINILDALITNSFESGNYIETQKYLEQWNKEKPEEPHSLEKFNIEVIKFMEKNNTPMSISTRLISLSFDVLHQSDVYKYHQYMSKREDNDSEWLSYVFNLKCSNSLIKKLNSFLIDRIVEDEILSDYPSLFTARFQSA